MDLYILIAFYLLLFLISFVVHNKELTNPTFIFFMMFIIMFSVAYQYKNIWWPNSFLNIKTIFVVLLGGISFFCGSVFGEKNFFGIKKIKIKGVNFNKNGVILPYKYIIWIGFQMVLIILCIRYVMSFGGSDLTTSLGQFRNSSVAEGAKLPGLLSFMISISFVGGMFFSYLLAIILVNKTKKNIIYILINFLLSILISLLGGNKGGSITLIVSFICFMLMVNSNLTGWKKNIPLKYLIPLLLLVIIIISQFKNLAEILGQSQVKNINTIEYLVLYIGSQIKNLDLYFSTDFSRSVIFGQETFKSFIQLFSKIFGISEWASYKLYVPMRYAGGMALGNVYTMYYGLFRDFGWIGIVIMSYLLGFISQIFYKNAKESLKNNECSISLILFGYIYYAIAFSFFSNIFYEQIISVSMIKYIVCAFIVRFFFFGGRYAEKK